MLPLKDENPTLRPAIVTALLIVANVLMFAVIQEAAQGTPTIPNGDLRFNLEHAAIPCELTQGRPLTVEEAQATFNFGDDQACRSDPVTPELFPDKSVWLAVLTSMFLHGGWLHLGGNMLFLWIFGNNIEDHLGPVRYLAFYVLGGIAATAAHVLVAPDSTVPVVGASGAIAAVMGAYLVWFPRAPIHTLFFALLIFFGTVQAKFLLIGWFVLQFFTAPDAGVAWVAHVGGFLFGMAVAVVVKQVPAVRRAVWRRPYATQVRPFDWR